MPKYRAKTALVLKAKAIGLSGADLYGFWPRGVEKELTADDVKAIKKAHGDDSIEEVGKKDKG